MAAKKTELETLIEQTEKKMNKKQSADNGSSASGVDALIQSTYKKDGVNYQPTERDLDPTYKQTQGKTVQEQKIGKGQQYAQMVQQTKQAQESMNRLLTQAEYQSNPMLRSKYPVYGAYRQAFEENRLRQMRTDAIEKTQKTKAQQIAAAGTRIAELNREQERIASIDPIAAAVQLGDMEAEKTARMSELKQLLGTETEAEKADRMRVQGYSDDARMQYYKDRLDAVQRGKKLREEAEKGDLDSMAARLLGAGAEGLTREEKLDAIEKTAVTKLETERGITDALSAALVGGGESWLSGMATMAEYALNPMNPNFSYAQKLNEAYQRTMAEATDNHGEVATWMIEQLPSAGSMALDALTSIGLGAAAGALGTAASPLGKAITKKATSSLAVMGVRAAGNSALQAMEQGATPGQALALGVAQGGIEVLTEKLFGGNPVYDDEVGLINRLAGKITKNKTVMRVLDSKGFDVASEGLEEVLSEILDPMAEMLVMGKAEIPTAADLGNAFLGGVFISVLGNLADAPNQVRQARYERTMRAVSASLVEQAKSIPNEQVQEAAQVLEEKLAYGRTPEVQEVGALIDAAERANAELDTERTAQAVRQTEMAQEQAEYANAQEKEAAKAERALRDFFQKNEKTPHEDVAKFVTESDIDDSVLEAVWTRMDDAGEITLDEEGNWIYGGSKYETVLNDGGKRNEGLDSGRPVGKLEEGTGGTEARGEAGAYAGAGGGLAGAGTQGVRLDRLTDAQIAEKRETVQEKKRQIAELGLQKQSPASLIGSAGAQEATLYVLPESLYTRDANEAKELAQKEGVNFRCVVGLITLKGGRSVDGYFDPDTNTITVRLDSLVRTAKILTQHELYHKYANEDTSLNHTLREKIRAVMGEEAYSRLLDAYAKAYEGCYDLSNQNDRDILEEELLADAYAGMNRVGAEGAAEHTETVRKSVNERRSTQNDAATERTTGPTEKKFSIAEMKKLPWVEQLKKHKRNDTLVVQNNTDAFLEETDLPMAVPVSVITKAKSEKDASHSVSDSSIRKLQKGIKNAPIVINNPARNSIVYVTDLKEEGKGLVTVAFLKNQEFDGDRVHKATSIHIREDPMQMLNSLDENATVYARKNELDVVPRSSLLKSGTLTANIKFIDDSVAEETKKVKQKMSASEDTDSKGEKLTAAQQSFFKESKIRDENGKLLVVYHGSPRQFTEFSAKFMSEHGSSEGQGFYFTDSKSMAQGYEKTGGQLLEGYLDIKKPLSDSDVTLTRAQVKRLLMNIDPTGDDVILNYDSKGGMGYPSKAWYSRSLNDAVNMIYDGSDSDSEILAEIANSGAGTEKTVRAARDTFGYDGYIIKGKYDGANVYVAFESNQFKNTDNLNPTENQDIRYSASEDEAYRKAAEDGDTETAQRMVDAAAERAGYTRLLYHGAKGGGGFNEFRDWGYFTENEAYARRYMKRDDEGSLYKTYVKAEKPFDTREQEAARIFRKMRNEYGLSELQENGLPDWTDGYDIADFIDENDMDYDMIVLNEGGDLVNGKPVSRGESYVVRDSAQIKRADAITYDDAGNIIPLSERFNPERRDIRYAASEDDDTEIPAYAKREENRLLREMRDAVGASFYRDADEVRGAVRAMTQEVLDTGTISAETKENALETILENGVQVDSDYYEQYSEVRDYLRKKKIAVPEDVRRGIADYNDFRKRAFGKLRLTNRDGMGIYTAYQELQSMAPELFPDDVYNVSDQLLQMWQAVSGIWRQESNVRTQGAELEQYAKERIDELANRLQNRISAYQEKERREEQERRGAEEAQQARDSFDARQKEAEELLGSLNDSIEVGVLDVKEIDPEWSMMNTEQMQGIYQEYAKSVSEDRRLSEGLYWFMQQKVARGDMARRKTAISELEAGRRMQDFTRDGFTGSEGLQKLGVKIARSVAAYGNEKGMIAADRAAKSIRKAIRQAENRLAATPGEKAYAEGIATGVYSSNDIPKNMDRNTVIELADYYMASIDAGSDLITQRKQDIKRNLQNVMGELFDRVENVKPQKALTLNYNSTQRNVIRIFGDERGAEINRLIFDPINDNEAERIRFVNRQIGDVSEFEGEDGKKSKLTEEESSLVQRVIEGKDVASLIAADEMAESIRIAADEIADGKSAADAAREWGLSREQRQLAEKYVTWKQTLEELKDADKTKIGNAVRVYQEKFAEFYDAINEFLVVHGFETIGFIKNYAPHMQPEETQNLLTAALQKLGVETAVTELPTSIAGLTGDWKPNKKWNPYFLSRVSDVTQFDIQSAFQSYVQYMSEVLYHTDDIMTVRQMSDYFRMRFAPEEIRQEIDRIRQLRNASGEEKREYLRSQELISMRSVMTNEEMDTALQEHLDQLFKDNADRNKFSNFVMYLDNYANILAGKQSIADRGLEQLVGRKILNLGSRVVSAFGKAQVAGNLSSVLNQSAQLSNIIGDKGVRTTARALADLVGGKCRKADFAQRSDYLTAKKGVSYLVTDRADMIVSKLFAPAEFADGLMSTLAVRAAYLEGIDKGMTDKEAMRYADKYGRRVMGDRSKGGKPVAFASKNPVMQMVNVFQIEALNTWQHLAADTLGEDFRAIERENGKNAAARAVAGVIVKTILSAFLLNRIGEEVYGGTPAPFDFFGITANFVASGMGLDTNEWIRTVIDNGTEKLTGKRIFDTEEADGEFDFMQGASEAFYNITNDVPFVRNLAGLLGWGDETLPIPDLGTVFGNIGNDLKEGVTVRSALTRAGELAGEVLPGGRQATKTVKGLTTMIKGGAYTPSGRLKYAVDQNDPLKWIQALLFGQNALTENRQYWASGGKYQSEKKTNQFEELKDAGFGAKEAEKVLKRLDEAGDKNVDKFREIGKMTYPDSSLDGLYGMVLEVTMRKKIDALYDYGITYTDYAKFKTDFADIYPEEGISGERAKDIIDDMALTKNKKAALYQLVTGREPKKDGTVENPYNAEIGLRVYESVQEIRNRE